MTGGFIGILLLLAFYALIAYAGDEATPAIFVGVIAIILVGGVAAVLYRFA